MHGSFNPFCNYKSNDRAYSFKIQSSSGRALCTERFEVMLTSYTPEKMIHIHWIVLKWDYLSLYLLNNSRMLPLLSLTQPSKRTNIIWYIHQIFKWKLFSKRNLDWARPVASRSISFPIHNSKGQIWENCIK